MKLYQVWVWADDWEVATTCLGEGTGNSFEEACVELSKRDKQFSELFNRETMTFWGCKLHDRKPRLV